ncbi:substrate-binding periplasmic protein [Paracoccus suum]|nr:transporter substrate-binding domain-containing protein [Paracoccus suum]
MPIAAPAQDTPYIAEPWRYGRNDDKNTLRYCIDPRDSEWKIAQDIAQQIAAALLLEPAPKMIEDKRVTAGWDVLYTHLLTDCDVYFGFKLIPGVYPGWVTLTRPYYASTYVFAVTDPSWQSLADIPPDRPIATAIGTSADFSFIKYLQTLPPARQWPRFPMGTNEDALAALSKGTAAAALVWGPAVWAAKEANPAYADLRLIAPDPLPPTTLNMGAAMLGNQSFLRSNVDRAISELTADGTIAAILKDHAFPAEPVP